MKIIQNIEDVLMEKIVIQKQTIARYREIESLISSDRSEDKGQMKGVFEEVEALSDQLLKLDLMFTNYFDQYKRALNIKVLDELDREQQVSFSLIQQLVTKVNSLQDQINSLKEIWAETEISLKRTQSESRQKQKASAAYKNINKL